METGASTAERAKELGAWGCNPRLCYSLSLCSQDPGPELGTPAGAMQLKRAGCGQPGAGACGKPNTFLSEGHLLYSASADSCRGGRRTQYFQILDFLREMKPRFSVESFPFLNMWCKKKFKMFCECPFPPSIPKTKAKTAPSCPEGPLFWGLVGRFAPWCPSGITWWGGKGLMGLPAPASVHGP